MRKWFPQRACPTTAATPLHGTAPSPAPSLRTLQQPALPTAPTCERKDRCVRAAATEQGGHDTPASKHKDGARAQHICRLCCRCTQLLRHQAIAGVGHSGELQTAVLLLPARKEQQRGANCGRWGHVGIETHTHAP